MPEKRGREPNNINSGSCMIRLPTPFLVDPFSPSRGLTWRERYQYDAAGRLTLHALPSAVSGHSLDTMQQLTVTLNADSGLIEQTDYHAAGAAAGYFRELALKRGSAGALVKQLTVGYQARTAGGVTVLVPSAETVYRDSTGGDPGLTTSFSYRWHGDTTQVRSRTVTHPPVPAAQNGPGSADEDETWFDVFGRPIWHRDGDGFLHYTEYDPGTGAATTAITDVNTVLTGDFQNKPTDWMTPTGGGLHLKTLREVDGRNR